MTLFNIETEVNNIITLFDTNCLNIYKINSLFNNDDKQQILLLLLEYINIKCFKLEYYYNLFEFIIINFNNIYNSVNINTTVINNIIKCDLLNYITRIKKGQFLLKLINFNIYKFIPNNSIINFLLLAAKSGTIAIFIFWLKKTSEKTINNLPPYLYEEILIQSISNHDDRIYKYMLEQIITINKSFFEDNTILITNMIYSFKYSCIPPKYILRRLKLLSKYVDLVPYFNIMITIFKSIKLLIEIHKYYYNKPYTFNILDILFKNIFTNMFYDNIITINFIIDTNKILNYLQTPEEKIIANIILHLKYNITLDKVNIDFNTNNLNNIIIEHIDNIMNIILSIDYYLFLIYLNSTFTKKIFSIIILNNLFTPYLQQYNKKFDYKYLLFTRFFTNKIIVNSIDNYIIKANLLLHNLRIYTKHFKKNKLLIYNIKMYNIHYDIKYFKPNIYIPILKNGSINYQLNKQKFTIKSSRYLLPNELYNYNDFILRENINSIITYYLPHNIYPYNNIFNNTYVKAEYIEDLDLYLIIDIDIPNTSIIERYNILRNLHPYTKNLSINICNNIEDIYSNLYSEKILINKFIDDNKHITIKWFPKYAAYFSLDKLDKIKFIDNIINNVIFNKNNIYTFNYNGLILNPLNENQEIIIKPLQYLSIDLLYNNNNWLDNNNNNWNHIIDSEIENKYLYKFNIPKTQIFQCYINNIKNIKFIVYPYKCNNLHPDSYKTVNDIINILSYDWNKELSDF